MKKPVIGTFSSLAAKFAAMAAALAFACAGLGATTQVATQADLSTAVANATAGDTVQITAAGTYTLGNIPQGITIEGGVSGVTLDYSGVGEDASFGTAASGTTFKSIDFTMGTSNYRGWQHSSGLFFEDCTFSGKFFSYGDMTFTDCVFTQTANDYHMWIYGNGKVSYIRCTFNYVKKCLHVYTDQNDGHKWEVYCTECEFNPADATDSGNKGALNVKNSSFSPASVDVVLDDCTTTDTTRGLVQLENALANNPANTAVAIGTDIDLDENGDIVSGEFTTLYTGATAEAIVSDASTIEDNGDGTYTVAAVPADPYAAYTKVADGFYQSAAKYVPGNGMDIYITSLEGFKYFRDLVNGVSGVADVYVTTYYNAAGTWTSWYSNNIFNGMTVHLMADIDLDNEEWSPIGQPKNMPADKCYFYGNFNGENHTISNLKATSYTAATKTWYAGLFGTVSGTQTFSNLTIHNVTLVGYDYAGAFVGNAGSNATTFNNCHVTGDIDIKCVMTGAFVGGIVGIGTCAIDNCSVVGNSGSTIEGSTVGGLAGTSTRTAKDNAKTVTDSTVSGVTIQSGDNGGQAGGLVGKATNPVTVTGNTVHDVTVSAEAGKADALVGGVGGVVTASNNTTDTNVTVVSDPITGSGTEADPYIIANIDALKAFRDRVDLQLSDGSSQYAGKYFKLTADIDLDGENWEPIGSMVGDHGSFQGVFDGDGHTISNLNVQKAEKGLGFFSYTTGNAVIKNLTFENVTVKSTSPNSHNTGSYVGGVVGDAFASTMITNVHVTGAIDIEGYGYVGGIVGHGYVKVSDSSVVGEGTISGNMWCVGGIVGYAGEGTTDVKNTYVTGTGTTGLTIQSAAGGLGAIVGMAEDNGGSQPISGSNLAATNVTIKTFVGRFGTDYATYALGYLYGGNPGQNMTGSLSVDNVTFDAQGNTNPPVNDAVASVGNDIYFSLTSAVTAAQPGDTVTVLRNVDQKETVTISKNITIDLNGHTITLAAGVENAFVLSGDGTKLTVKDGDSAGTASVGISGYAENYMLSSTTADGATTYTAAPAVASVAKSGATTYYTDLHAALEAGKSAGSVVTLLADVDLDGVAWTPVGTQAEPFSGTFDGDGHTISNLYISLPEQTNVGLFASGGTATYRNFTIYNANVLGYENVAAVFGRTGGQAFLATNITVCGSIKVESVTTSKYGRVGGIAGGWVYGHFVDCSVIGDGVATSYIKAPSNARYAGGIVGHADDVQEYTRCVVKDVRIIGDWLCGGIAGPGPASSVTSGCVVDNVEINADYSGGLFGWFFTLSSQADETKGVVSDCTVSNISFTLSNSRNGVIGGYAMNENVVVKNLTVGDVHNYSDDSSLITYGATIVDDETGDTYFYATVAQAVQLAESGETVALIKDSSEDITLSEAKTVTIDTGEYEFTGTVTADDGYIVTASSSGTATTYTTAVAVAAVISADGAITNKFESFMAAIDSIADCEGDDIILNVLEDITEEGPDASKYIYKNLTITTGNENGVTVNLVNHECCIDPRGGGVITIDEKVSIEQVGQFLVWSSPSVLNVYGGAGAYQLWTFGGTTANIYPSAHVTLGYGDGMLKMRGGGTLNVYGSLADGAALTVDSSVEKQLSGGYISIDGTYGASRVHTINLTNTYVSTTFLNGGGDSTVNVNLDNSVLYLSSYFNMGSGTTGTVNLNGSRIVSNGNTLTVNASDTIRMDCTSSIAAKNFAVSGIIDIDATGMAAATKMIDYTGTGTMALADYGTVNVTLGEAYVEDNDLWVKPIVAIVVSSDGATTNRFDTLAGAVTAAQDSDSVILVADIAAPYTLASGNTLVICKDGHELTVVADGAYVVQESTEGGATTYSLTAPSFSMSADGATSYFLTLAEAVNAAPTNGTAATVTALVSVTEPGFSTKVGQIITLTFNSGANVFLTSKATVAAGSILTLESGAAFANSTATTSTADAVGVATIDSYGTLNLSGAQVIGVVTAQDGGTINVTKGTSYYVNLIGENGSTVNFTQTSSYIRVQNAGQILAKSGSTFTFSATTSSRLNIYNDLVVEDGAIVAISAGTYKTPIAQEWCASGYAPTRTSPTGPAPYAVVLASNTKAKIVTTDGDEFAYTSVSGAMSASNDGDTIVLLSDHPTTGLSVSTAKQLVVDLNGFSMKSVTFWYGDVTITNGTIVQDIDLYPQVQNSGKVSNLTIANGCTVTDGIVLWPEDDNGTGTGYDANLTVYGTVNNGIFVSGNLQEGNSTITIKDGGVVTDTTSPAISVNGYAILNVEEGATVTGPTGIEIRAGGLNITGGTITETASSLSAVAEGSGSSVTGAAVAISQHTTQLPIAVSITGGTLDASAGGVALYETNIQNGSVVNETVAVSGGTFNGDVQSVSVDEGDDGISFAISGGEFSSVVDADYCAAGYEPTTEADPETGLYTVQVEAGKVARNVTQNAAYASLALAVSAANAGDTIELLADYTMADALTVEAKDLTIDLGGNTLTFANGKNNYVKKGANVTIANGEINFNDVTVGGDCIVGIGGYDNIASTLTLDGVTMTGKDYSSAYAVLYTYANSTLNITNSTLAFTNDTASAGGAIKGNAASSTINIANSTLDFTDVVRGFTTGVFNVTDSTVTMGTDEDGVGSFDNGINSVALTLDNSQVAISGGTGRGLTLNGSDAVVANGSTLAISGMGEGDIMFRSGNTLTVSGDSNVTAPSVVRSGAAGQSGEILVQDTSSLTTASSGGADDGAIVAPAGYVLVITENGDSTTTYTVIEGYAEGDTPEIAGDTSHALTANEAALLNELVGKYNGKAAVETALAGMESVTAFEDAALLNIDITKEWAEPSFRITSIRRNAKATPVTVTVTVTLDRKGNEAGNAIYGTVALLTSADGKTGWGKGTEVVADGGDDNFSGNGSTVSFTMPAEGNNRIFKAIVVDPPADGE